MSYNVIDTLNIGNNTVVTLEGECADLRNGMSVKDENGKKFNLLTVALEAGTENILKTTTVLIQGEFSSKIIVTV